MSIQYSSSRVQQNFGRVMDQAVTDQVVIVERYGEPRVVILDYRRYVVMLASEQELIRLRLRQASESASARAAKLSDEQVGSLIESARKEVYQSKRRRRATR
jgi:prevent-host-death family protein